MILGSMVNKVSLPAILLAETHPSFAPLVTSSALQSRRPVLLTSAPQTRPRAGGRRCMPPYPKRRTFYASRSLLARAFKGQQE